MKQIIESGQQFNEQLVFVIPPDDSLRKPLIENGNSLDYCIQLVNHWYESGQLKLSIYLFDAIVHRFGFDYYKIGGIGYPHAIVTFREQYYAAVPAEIFRKAMYEDSILDRTEKLLKRIRKCIMKYAKGSGYYVGAIKLHFNSSSLLL
jgi:hypothetical protein